MPRLHFFELHEQPWCPAPIRHGVTEALAYLADTFDFFGPLRSRLIEAFEASGSTEVVDLCSGSGGPWLGLVTRSVYALPIRRVTMTDLHPNVAALEVVRIRSGGLLAYEASAVDARAVPEHLRGFRTLFASFHHFRPGDAARILRDAVDRGEGIAIVEPGGRSAKHLLGVVLIPLAMLVLTPWIRPVRASRFLFTYLLPAIPLALFFDGVVSCLRTYAPEDLERLVAEADPGRRHTWSIGRARMGRLPIDTTYLIGVPAGGPASTGAAAS